MTSNYYYKYLKYKKKYYKIKTGGYIAFNINKNAKNVNPESDFNCGPMVLNQLDILTEEQTKLTSELCEPTSPLRYAENGGMYINDLVKYIKKSGKDSDNSKYIVRTFNYTNFDKFWNNYAKKLLKPYTKKGMIIFLENPSAKIGHFTVLVNNRNKPCFMDKHKHFTKLGNIVSFDTYITYYAYLSDKNNLWFTSLEDINDINYEQNIGIVDYIDSIKNIWS
jgi:hypothetical protein